MFGLATCARVADGDLSSFYGEKASIERCEFPHNQASGRETGRTYEPSECRNLGRALLCGALGILASSSGDLSLGRWQPRNEAGVTVFPGALAYLVRSGRDSAVLSVVAQRLLAGAPDVGRFRDGLSSHQRRATRRVGLSCGDDCQASFFAWGVVRRFHFRGAPGLRGSGGLDLRAKEHVVRGLLPGRCAYLSAL